MKKIKELVGYGKPTERSSKMVVDMISRRLDYVRQNGQIAQKQLDAADKKLKAASILLLPDLDDEEGLPLTDIQEELDEEGNVISSTLLHPSKAAPDILNTLRKAGITDLDKEDRAEKNTPKDLTNEGVDVDLSKKSEAMDLEGKTPTSPDASSSSQKATKEDPPPSRKKFVAFSPDTKPEAQTTSKNAKLISEGFNDDLAAFTFNSGSKIIELDDNDDELAQYPIIPKDESPEDAALRREMLQYGLSEVGSVVAEIDLDEGNSEYSGSEDDYDGEYPDTDDEEEDKFGRTTRKVITDDYKLEMLELEKRLNARMLENLGPRPEGNPLAKHAEDVRRLRIQEEKSTTEPTIEPARTNEDLGPMPDAIKKGVRFVDKLDIAPKSEVADNKPTETTPVAKVPVAGAVVERSGKEIPNEPSEVSTPAKVSRFKRSHASTATTQNTGFAATKIVNTASPTLNSLAQATEHSRKPRYTPEGPLGRTLASSIVERTVADDNVVPPDEDGLDLTLLNQEIAVEYHKLRNRMIHNQGGFMPSKEEEENPLMENVDGRVKKVSRFMAARLKNESM